MLPIFFVGLLLRRIKKTKSPKLIVNLGNLNLNNPYMVYLNTFTTKNNQMHINIHTWMVWGKYASPMDHG